MGPRCNFASVHEMIQVPELWDDDMLAAVNQATPR